MSNWIAVFLGGGLGSCCRYALSLWFPPKPLSFPFATLAANVLSCVVLGLAARYFLPKVPLHESWKLLVMVGFCGGFSTFSTFSRESLLLMQQGAALQAAFYILLSISSCIFLLWGIDQVKF
ncbi:MAG: fluoride efflux transporter CrcB [Bacteroidota bacterium]